MYLEISDLAPCDLRAVEAGAVCELKVEFKLPFDNESISSVSEIKWSTQVRSSAIGLGMKFLDLGMRDRGKILRYAVGKSVDDR